MFGWCFDERPAAFAVWWAMKGSVCLICLCLDEAVLSFSGEAMTSCLCVVHYRKGKEGVCEADEAVGPEDRRHVGRVNVDTACRVCRVCM